MQTFLPYGSFPETALCLDNKRLGKQRVEAWQIYLTLTENRKAWSSHPAVLMWKGYEEALAFYGLAICAEWRRRGFQDTMYDRFAALQTPVNYPLPSWVGERKFHASHRSNLLRKDPKFYGQYGWGEKTDLPYCWPVRKAAVEKVVSR